MSEDSHLDLEPVMSTSTDSSTYSVVSHPNPNMAKTIKVAAVQAEPVWNDLAGGVEKVCAIINTAAKEGTNVIGFPEVFIPGYPWRIWARGPLDNDVFMKEYFQNSMARESPEMETICAAVKEAGMFCVLGYSERYRGTLYIAQSFINEKGVIVHHRRKIKPTHVERAYYGDGQGESLKIVVPSPFGNIGALNCWEHSQPLLRYYEYSQDVEIHISGWPPIWDKPESAPDWPGHISAENCGVMSKVLAIEGTCFVLLASQIMTEEGKKRCGLEDFFFAKCPGGGFSQIYNPYGEPIAKTIPAGEEGILYADADLNMKRDAQMNLDVVGHYCRPDQLSLRVNKNAAKPVFFAGVVEE